MNATADPLFDVLRFHYALEKDLLFEAADGQEQKVWIHEIEPRRLCLKFESVPPQNKGKLTVFSFKTVYHFDCTLRRVSEQIYEMDWPDKIKTHERRRSPRLPFSGHLAPLEIFFHQEDKPALSFKASDLSATGFQIHIKPELTSRYPLDATYPVTFHIEGLDFAGSAQVVRKERDALGFNFVGLEVAQKLELNRLIQSLITQLQASVLATSERLQQVKSLLRNLDIQNSEQHETIVHLLTDLLDPILLAFCEGMESVLGSPLEKKKVRLERINRGLIEVALPYLFKAEPLQGMLFICMQKKVSDYLRHEGPEPLPWSEWQRQFAELAQTRLRVGTQVQGLHIRPLFPKTGPIHCLSLLGRETFLRIPFENNHGHIDFFLSISGITTAIASGLSGSERAFHFHQEILQALFDSVNEILEAVLGVHSESRGVEFKPHLQPKFESGALVPLRTDHIQGDVFLNISQKFALHLQDVLLGDPGPNIHPDFHDALGEVLNMIGGAAKSHLPNAGDRYRLGVPKAALNRPDLMEMAGEHAFLSFVFTSNYGPFEVCVSIRNEP